MCIDVYVKFDIFWCIGDMLMDYFVMVIFDVLWCYDNIYWFNMMYKWYLMYYGVFDDILM